MLYLPKCTIYIEVNIALLAKIHHKHKILMSSFASIIVEELGHTVYCNYNGLRNVAVYYIILLPLLSLSSILLNSVQIISLA